MLLVVVQLHRAVLASCDDLPVGHVGDAVNLRSICSHSRDKYKIFSESEMKLTGSECDPKVDTSLLFPKFQMCTFESWHPPKSSFPESSKLKSFTKLLLSRDKISAMLPLISVNLMVLSWPAVTIKFSGHIYALSPSSWPWCWSKSFCSRRRALSSFCPTCSLCGSQ